MNKVLLRFTVLLVFTLAVSGTARARDTEVAVYVEGKDSEEISAELVAALPSQVKVINASKLKYALSDEDVKSVAASLKTAKLRRTLIGQLHAAAKAIGADAVVLGALGPGGRKGERKLQLIVLLSEESELAVDESIPIKDEDRTERWKALVAAPIETLRDQATSVEESAGEAAGDDDEKPAERERKADADADAEADSAPRTYASALVSAFLGVDFGARHFHYNDRLTDSNLRPYDLPEGPLFPVAPGVAASIEVFPLALTGWSIARDLGVSSRVQYNFVSSKIGNVKPDTKWYGWEVNLRGRVPLGQGRSLPLIGLEVGLGQLAFEFSAPGNTADVLPSVDYSYWRFGADTRIPIGTAAVLGGLAYRLVQSSGSLEDRFPRADVSGLELRIGGALALSEMLEARLSFNYVRFWAALNPRPGDAYVAGGATDQMLNGDLGVGLVF